jgi:hypothetical protein
MKYIYNINFPPTLLQQTTPLPKKKKQKTHTIISFAIAVGISSVLSLQRKPPVTGTICSSCVISVVHEIAE